MQDHFCLFVCFLSSWPCVVCACVRIHAVCVHAHTRLCEVLRFICQESSIAFPLYSLRQGLSVQARAMDIASLPS